MAGPEKSPRKGNDPRKVAVLVVLLGLLVVVVLFRVRPAIQGTSAARDTAELRTGTYRVPELGFATDATEGLPTPQAGRNLFTYGPPPTPTPDPRPTATPRPTLPPRPLPTAPPPGITTASGKRMPPPPRFTMSYLGWLGPDRFPVAVFKQGEEVLAVPEGDTFKGSFVIRHIGPTEVTIGFVGYPPDVTTKIRVSR